MIAIRLKMIGTKNSKKWKLVVTESHAPRNGRLLEEIGFYNPQVNPPEVRVKLDRYESWVKRGAKPSDTVRGLVQKIKK